MSNMVQIVILVLGFLYCSECIPFLFIICIHYFFIDILLPLTL